MCSLALICPLWYVKRPCNIIYKKLTYVPSTYELLIKLCKAYCKSRVSLYIFWYYEALPQYLLYLRALSSYFILFWSSLTFISQYFCLILQSSVTVQYFLHVILILTKSFIEILFFICLRRYLISRVWQFYIITGSLKIKIWQSIVNSYSDQ